ncbi:hypothetical protein F5Y19DRAFT_372299 [Xylariaceae sp. FL1651]|nr:hypothetical protein F5Y19DRAFT_372299 [Xylariaceae sp. FL1651]
MATTVSTVISITELSDIIGSQMNNREALYNACLVNRAFNAVFTPYLYKVLRWQATNVAHLIDDDKRRRFFQGSGLEHVKTLILTRSVVERNISESRLHTLYEQLNAAIIDFCHYSRGLRAFACQDIALTPECLGALSSLPSLESVSIEFPLNLEYFVGFDLLGRLNSNSPHMSRMAAFGRPWESFAFTNLRKLSLNNILGDLDLWRDRMVQQIPRSPHLIHLSLSLSPILMRQISSVAERASMTKVQMLRDIGMAYNSYTGHKMRLQTIRLGWGLGVPHDLDLLTDLHALKEISIHTQSHADIPFHRTPDCLYLDNSVHNLEKVSIFRLSFPTDWRSPPLVATRESTLNPQRGLLKMIRIVEDSLASRRSQANLPPRQHLHDLVLPQSMGDLFTEENDRAMDIRWQQLVECTWITDLAIRLDYKGTYHLATTSCSSLASLTSLRNLWLLPNPMVCGRLPLARMAAATLPALQYIRVGCEAWRIHRHPDYNDGIHLEHLDKWEDEVEGPPLFHLPSPVPWYAIDVDHVDI